MKFSIPSIIDIHKDKTAIVFGLGPSAKTDIPKITDQHLVISCNDFDLMANLNPHYWVHSNSVDTIQKNYARYNAKKSIIVYADSIDLTPRDIAHRLLKVDYIGYDQRHFRGEKCKSQQHGFCCDHIDHSRLTIQEELQKYCAHVSHYGTGDTVAVHMLALAILLGCKTIYITGVDLDYSKGYINGSTIPANRMNDIKQHLNNIWNDFYVIGQSAQNVGCEIFITKPNAHIGNLFKVKEIS